jgi:Leucine-rich repeat (LRR) protein
MISKKIKQIILFLLLVNQIDGQSNPCFLNQHYSVCCYSDVIHISQPQKLKIKNIRLDIDYQKLTNNKTKEIINNLKEFKNLESISLSPEFGRRIKKLVVLEELNTIDFSLHNLNKNKDIYTYLSKLKHLKHLVLDNCYLENLPKEIGLLENLESLDLSRNKLTTIPKSLCHLKRLRKLSLNDNLISDSEISLEALPNLNTLDLGRNQLGKFERWNTFLVKNNSLKELGLEYNNLTNVPKQITNLNSLEFLVIADTSLKLLPEFILSLPKISHIYIGSNIPIDIPIVKRNILFVRYGDFENIFSEEEYLIKKKNPHAKFMDMTNTHGTFW